MFTTLGKVFTAVLGYQIRFQRLKQMVNETASEPLIAANRGSTKTSTHHMIAGPLLFTTVAMTFVGMWNTYCRTDRLFAGPHLFGGLGKRYHNAEDV